MDLATTLALIILIGAIGLAVVTVFAFVLYRHCAEQQTLPTQQVTPAPRAPALDVPPPTVPSEPPPADGAPAALDAEPPHAKTAESSHRNTSSKGDQHFLEYDGATFKPVSPPSWESHGNGSEAPSKTSANGFAWR